MVKILTINTVDRGEIVHVFEKDGAFDHIFEGHSGLVQDVFQVAHYLVGFARDVVHDQLPSFPVHGYLTRYIERIVHPDGLAVWANGFRGFMAVDNDLVHC